MLKIKFVNFLLLLFTGFIFFACSGKNNQSTSIGDNNDYIDPRVSTAMQRTKTDTLAVLYNVKRYLDFLKENQTDSAMTMLYEYNPDGEPFPISDIHKEAILNQLKIFPVLDYEIVQLNMFTEDDCEVHYTIKYFDKEPDNPMQNTIQCVINPVRHGYYWYLTIPEQSVSTLIE